MSLTFEEALEAIEANDVNFTDFFWADLSDYKPGIKPTRAQLERLANKLNSNLYVTRLDLSDSGIGDEGAEIIACIDNEILKSVILDNCNIGPRGIMAFENNKTVTTLGVDGSPIGPDGAKVAARNNTLKCLSAGKCQIGDEGALALWKNKNFEELYLGKNGITDAGLEGIENVNLMTLYLNDNNITSVGAEKLAKAKIQALHLFFNKIGNEGAGEFFDTKTIGYLSVTGNDISAPVGEELKRRAAKVLFPFRSHEQKKRKADDSIAPEVTVQKRFVHL